MRYQTCIMFSESQRHFHTPVSIPIVHIEASLKILTVFLCSLLLCEHHFLCGCSRVGAMHAERTERQHWLAFCVLKERGEGLWYWLAAIVRLVSEWLARVVRSNDQTEQDGREVGGGGPTLVLSSHQHQSSAQLRSWPQVDACQRHKIITRVWANRLVSGQSDISLAVDTSDRPQAEDEWRGILEHSESSEGDLSMNIMLQVCERGGWLLGNWGIGLLLHHSCTYKLGQISHESRQKIVMCPCEVFTVDLQVCTTQLYRNSATHSYSNV